jgi:chemotaxis protein MotA
MSFILGLLLSTVIIIFVALRGTDPAMLLNINALILVFGGTLASVFVICPFSHLKDQLKTLLLIFKPPPKEEELTEEIIELSRIARKEGVLSLEKYEKKIKDYILKRGLSLISYSADRDTVKGILEKESGHISRQEKSVQETLERLALFAPGIGMVGTLIQIAQIFFGFKTPQLLAPAIAQAILPVVYGAALTYFIIMPLTARLKAKAEKLKTLRELSAEGVLAIQAGEPPQIVRQRLEIFLPQDDAKITRIDKHRNKAMEVIQNGGSTDAKPNRRIAQRP